MKILLINDYTTQFGGAEKVLFDTKKILEEKGHTVKIFGGKKEDFFSFFSRVFSIKYYFQVKKLIKEFKPDIVHCHSFSGIISPSPIVAAKKTKIPVLVTLHDFHIVCPRTWMVYKNEKPCEYAFGWRCLISNCYGQKMGITNLFYNWSKWFKIWLHRKIVKRYVDYFICSSEILAFWVKKSLKINNIIVIPNFVDKKSIKNKKIKRKDNLFLFIGRLCKEKGVNVLIKAIKIVKEKHPAIKLKIIGEGPERKKLEKLSHQLNLQNNIKFLGFLQNTKLYKYYQEGSAVIIPSIWMENCPLIVLEAMSYYCPIIASRTGGIPELIKEGYNGFLFKPRDEKQCTEKIIEILKDRKKAEKIAENAFVLFKNKFTKEKYYTDLMKIYEKLI